jgi:hypothetical protein
MTKIAEERVAVDLVALAQEHGWTQSALATSCGGRAAT